MKPHKIVAAIIFSSILMVGTAIAEELTPLRPGVVRILQRVNIPADDVAMTSAQQRLFIAKFSTFVGRSRIEDQIEAFDVENRYLGSTSPSLRQIIGNEDERTLSAREERRIRRALRRPGVPEIDFDSLSYSEKSQLLVATSTSAIPYDFVRIVNSLLANR